MRRAPLSPDALTPVLSVLPRRPAPLVSLRALLTLAGCAKLEESLVPSPAGVPVHTIAADEVLADTFEQLVWAGSADAVDDVTGERRALLRGVEAVVAADACDVDVAFATSPEGATPR